MSKEKRNKHGYAEVLKYMHLIKSGRTFNSIHREYGVNEGRTEPAILHTDQGSVYASMAYNELIKDTNIIRSMSRAGKPTDNPVNEALNGWIKEELCTEFRIEQHWRSPGDFRQTIERYVKYYNTQRPCFAIGYDTPDNYRRRYYKGELPRKNTFADRVLTPEPKFVQKRRQLADNQHSGENVSTFGKEMSETNRKMSTFVNSNTKKNITSVNFCKLLTS